MSNTHNRKVRKESRPLRQDDLTSRQRHAFDGINALLGQMVRDESGEHLAPNAQTPEGLVHAITPHIDSNRENRVILIDGDRGIGKTTVLVSLIDNWRKKLLERVSSSSSEDETVIVPVGLIDLLPLAKSTTLLLHVTASLEKIVDSLRSRKGLPKVAATSSILATEKEDASSSAWSQFVNVASRGWARDLRQRASSMDAESHAIEEELAASSQLAISRIFRNLLDALISEVAPVLGAQKSKVIFVLGIDDADMNPDKCIELLHILRLLWHPQLSFLLTGDSELFLHLLKQTFFQGLHQSTSGEFQRSDSESQALGIADEFYEKTIPTPHRFGQLSLTRKDRIQSFSDLQGFLGAASWASHGVPGLSMLLMTEEIPQLWDAFPDYFRGLKRFEDELAISSEASRRRTGQVKTSQVLRMLGELYDGDGVQERDSLESLSQEAIDIQEESAYSSQFVRSWAGEWRFDNGIVFRSHRLSRNFFILENGVLLGNQEAAFLLWTSDYQQLGHSMEQWPTAPPPKSHEASAFSTSVNVGKSSVEFYWPVPEWQSFHEFAKYRERIMKIQVGITQPDNEPQVVTFARRHLAACLFLDRDVLDSIFSTDLPTLGELAQFVARLAGALSDESEPLSEWARHRAGLLAAPEAGLPAKDANEYLYALESAFAEKWTDIRLNLSRSRKKIASHAFQGESRHHDLIGYQEAGNFLSKLDLLAKDHIWASAVESYIGKFTIEEVVKRVSGMLVDMPVGSSLKSQSTMECYFTTSRGLRLSRASLQTQMRWEEVVDATRSVSGAAPLVFNQMWRSAVLERDSPKLLSLLSDNLDGIAPSDVVKLLRKESSTPYETHGKHHRFVFYPPPNTQWVIDEIPLAPEIGALWEIGRDLNQDLNDLDERTTAFVPAVRYFGVFCSWFADEGPFTLAVPAWPAFLDHALLDDSWNGVLEQVRALPGVHQGQAGQVVADSLLLSLVASNQQVFEHRFINRSFSLRATPRMWSELYELSSSTMLGRSGARTCAHRNWLQRIGLLAAPELGLSSESAYALLEEVLEEVIDSPGCAQYLRTERKAIFADAGVSWSRAEESREALPEHPWFKFVEPK